jgi:hypothetical protein
MVVVSEVVGAALWRDGNTMTRLASTPPAGVASNLVVNQVKEAVGMVRSVRVPGLNETTAGTTIHGRRFRPNKVLAASWYPFVNVFRATGAATGSWTAGRFWLSGVWILVTNEPTVIGPITESLCYWIKLDLDSGPVPVWDSGPLAGGYPAMTDTIFIWRMLELTFAGGRITNVLCPHPADIYLHAKSY